MNAIFSFQIALLLLVSLAPQSTPIVGEWTDWRGPTRDGISLEKGLPTRWSPEGENVAWKAPYGGRSGPIVMGDRVYLQNSVGKGQTLQERIICLNADTGKVLWEHRFNVYSSDVPPHRVGWASPVGDPTTGNVYVTGVCGVLLGLSKDGKLLWQRSLVEDFGLWTTHGGRTVSPVIEGDVVIISGPTEGWGDQAARRHRFLAFDKRTGETVWVVSPGERPYDTTYSPPIAATVNGTRLLIAGAGDGAVHALKPLTGEPVWRFAMAKRGINTGIVVNGTNAIVSHSEENLETNEMGLLASLDAGAKGALNKSNLKWSVPGFQGGFSSPVLDGNRLYQIDNGANLLAFDVNTGKQLWTLSLGTIQKSSPVLAEGKLYVGTENGKFYILKPGPDKCEILDQDQLGAEGAPEAIVGSVAIYKGRIFLVSDSATYCIGKKSNVTMGILPGIETAPADAVPTYVQVVPNEMVLKPGDTAKFRTRLFDDKGRFIREEQQASWSLDRIKGTIQAGTVKIAGDAVFQTGLVKATVGQIVGTARIRVMPTLPWTEGFESYAPDSVPPYWINTEGKYVVRDLEGGKVLVKKPEPPIFKRGRAFFGPSDLANYTVQADVRVTERRRQSGDAGIIAQRYALVLFGTHQRLALESWQPETSRTVKVPFEWKPETWYRLKLQVENLADGKVRIRGKAWPASAAEPEAWAIDHYDPIPNRQGSPGIYADAPADIFFDNVRVTVNR